IFPQSSVTQLCITSGFVEYGVEVASTSFAFEFLPTSWRPLARHTSTELWAQRRIGMLFHDAV
ncbi:hypothetical protein, partial [Croceicoccus bisphenolivorans]|uniref:hypothetical protein n=1 Tax=Croceicoccus bisphenolivorans TaxID=1783232 RepID=UPI001C129B9C